MILFLKQKYMQRSGKMLVLSRKIEESIIIDSNITVTVLDVRGDKVKLGISAPKDVTVNREEVELFVNKNVPKKQ